MITFKVVPVKNDKEFLVKEDDSFLSFELSGTDHKNFLEKKLQREFGVKFLISRSFLVLDSDNGLLIYTFVIPKNDFIKVGYEWTENLNPKDFDTYDEVAVNAISTLF